MIIRTISIPCLIAGGAGFGITEERSATSLPPRPVEDAAHREDALKLINAHIQEGSGVLSQVDPANLVAVTNNQTCRDLDNRMALNGHAVKQVANVQPDFVRSYFEVDGWYIAVLTSHPDLNQSAATMIVVTDLSFPRGGGTINDDHFLGY